MGEPAQKSACSWKQAAGAAMMPGFLGFALLPIIWSIILAFRPENRLFEPIRKSPTALTFANIFKIADSGFPRAPLTSFVTAGSSNVLALLIGVPGGFALAKGRSGASSLLPVRPRVLGFTGTYPHTNGVFRNDEERSYCWVKGPAEAGYHAVNIGKMQTWPIEGAFGLHERHVTENKDRDHPPLPFHLDNRDKGPSRWPHCAVTRAQSSTLRGFFFSHQSQAATSCHERIRSERRLGSRNGQI